MTVGGEQIEGDPGKKTGQDQEAKRANKVMKRICFLFELRVGIGSYLHNHVKTKGHPSEPFSQRPP